MQREWVSSTLISDARMQRLLTFSNRDVARAHELFEWNLRASGAALEATHVFELIFRNAVDVQLRSWNLSMGHSDSWTLGP